MRSTDALRVVTASIPDSPFLSAADTARLMGFPSREALSKARAAGRLPIRMFKLPGRRGWFASRQQVCAWVEAFLNEEDAAMT